MLITDIDTIKYLDFVKDLFETHGYHFLLLSVGRYADNRKYFQELEESWASIDNLTSEKIVFLNFSSKDRGTEQSHNFINRGGILGDREGINICSKELQLFKDYYLKYSFEGFCSFPHDLFKMKHLPKLKGRLNQNIDESATQLLDYLNKSETDIPFIYLLDLKDNKEYYLKFAEIYRQYQNFYAFLKAIIVAIEEKNQLTQKIFEYSNLISDIKRGLCGREARIKRKQVKLKLKQDRFNKPIIEIEAIKKYILTNKLEYELKYYLESIINIMK